MTAGGGAGIGFVCQSPGSKLSPFLVRVESPSVRGRLTWLGGASFHPPTRSTRIPCPVLPAWTSHCHCLGSA